MTETHDLRNQWYDEPVQYETPMTEKEQIQNQIQELQEKLQKLEEIEKQPRMNLQQEGEYAVVSYHDKVYYRLEGETTFSWYIKKDVSEYNIRYRSPILVMVEDAETERLLEDIYYNHIHVKKEKEQQTKTPVEECYKDWWGQYPETGTWDGFDEKRWQGFQAGYEFSYAISTAKEVMEKVQEEQQKLEEQDPEMLLLRQGKVDFVDYDGKKYIRIEYTDSFAGKYSWYVRGIGEDAVRPVRDINLYAPLEELYLKEVVKQKDDYPYKTRIVDKDGNDYKPERLTVE